jgi:hypothetical protein
MPSKSHLPPARFPQVIYCRAYFHATVFLPRVADRTTTTPHPPIPDRIRHKTRFALRAIAQGNASPRQRSTSSPVVNKLLSPSETRAQARAIKSGGRLRVKLRVPRAPSACARILHIPDAAPRDVTYCSRSLIKPRRSLSVISRCERATTGRPFCLFPRNCVFPILMICTN